VQKVVRNAGSNIPGKLIGVIAEGRRPQYLYWFNPMGECSLPQKFITMKPFTYLFLISLISLTFSCNKDDEQDALTKDGPFQISELAGSWEATKAQFSVNTISIDVVEDGGTANLSVQSNGRFSLTLDPVDRSAYTVSGEMYWEEWQQTFHFAIVWDDDPGDWDTYGHTFDGTTLSLNGGTESGEYDFNNDGDMEACSVHFIFVRS
jgi:hypothetical protein